MKKYINLIVLVLIAASFGCKKEVLNKQPQNVYVNQNFYTDPTLSTQAVNGIYDAATYEDGGNIPANIEWMFGDILSDDAEKGSTQNDFPQLQLMKEWRANPADNPVIGAYNASFQGIFRANDVIQNLQKNTITWDPALKTRLLGEAYFFRGYFYFYLLRLFGGMPVLTTVVNTQDFGKVQRSTFAQTCQFIEGDLTKAAQYLPTSYSAQDVGRATKGAAQAYLARVVMYQLGTDNTNKHTWQQVHALTDSVINTGKYSLYPNYAQLWELESENSSESIFELQFTESGVNWGPGKTGTNNNIYQNPRSTWGWGFNNPTQSLVNEYEPNDPRKPSTVYGNGDVVLGAKQVINYPQENFTGYLNRKAAIPKPAEPRASGQNIRKFRYADLLLMRAEADYHLGNEQEARDVVNQVRARARTSTLPKGSILGDATSYPPTNVPPGTLPPLTAAVTGNALLTAIWHERRVELGMEAIRFWDMVRTGTYLSSLPANIRANCQSHTIQGSVNPIPVLPLPLTEVQSWGLQQNPGY